MKSAKFREMLSKEDFWWYFISRMDPGQQDTAEAVLSYDLDHTKTGTPSVLPNNPTWNGRCGFECMGGKLGALTLWAPISTEPLRRHRNIVPMRKPR
jgi:hypothetical protein